MLSEITFKGDKYNSFSISNSNNGVTLDNLNKINIFIGQNNSGKSRFLRTIFSDKDFEFLLLENDYNTLFNILKDGKRQLRDVFDGLRIDDIDSIFEQLNQFEGRFNFNNKEVNAQIRLLKEFSTTLINKSRFTGWSGKPGVINAADPNNSRVIAIINAFGNKIKDCLNENFGEGFNYESHKIYIPILRGLRPVQRNGDFEFVNTSDNYKQRTMRDYFGIDSKSVEGEIFTGLSLYEDTKKLLLGKKTGRDNIKHFEEFLSEAFFHGQTVTLIPDIDNDTLLIGIGDSERSVYEYGDGIQTIIILLYPLFFNQNRNSLVFIEEPENSLHPGMQRIFLETLMRKEFSKFQFFISTHSNHFLDLSLEYDNISIYSVRKNESEGNKTLIENLSNSDVRILDLLGVRNSSIFLSNCTIWVEGITDRLYIRKYLDLLQNHKLKSNPKLKFLKEDLHYSFVEYAGSNIVHYAFQNDEDLEKIKASKISNRIMLIADTDDTLLSEDSAKAKRLREFKANLGENFIQLKVREIENLLKEDILLRVIADIENKSIENLSYDVNKLIFDIYKDKYLGDFIKEVFPNLDKKYADASGTIYNKIKFCKSAIAAMHNYDDLSDEAKRITEKIYQFILASNNY